MYEKRVALSGSFFYVMFAQYEEAKALEENLFSGDFEMVWE